MLKEGHGRRSRQYGVNGHGGDRRSAHRPAHIAIPRTHVAVSRQQAVRLKEWALANGMMVRDAMDRAIDMVVQS